MIHDRLPPEYKAASQMQRAWDYPKIATCPDSGCACSQISVSPSPRFFWQSERGILTNPTTFCRLILIESCRILSAHIENLSARFDALSDSIKAAEKRMVEVQALQQHIKNYRNTRQIYIEYRKSGYSKKFFEEHRQEITIHKAAKQAFDELQITKLPSMQSLYEEFHQLAVQKKQDYAEYRQIRKEKEELLIAKRTVETILNIDRQKEQEKEKEKEEKKNFR